MTCVMFYWIKLVGDEDKGTALSVYIDSRDGDFWLVLDLLTYDLKLQTLRHLNNVSGVSWSTEYVLSVLLTSDLSLLCALCTLFFFL